MTARWVIAGHYRADLPVTGRLYRRGTDGSEEEILLRQEDDVSYDHLKTTPPEELCPHCGAPFRADNTTLRAEDRAEQHICDDCAGAMGIDGIRAGDPLVMRVGKPLRTRTVDRRRA